VARGVRRIIAYILPMHGQGLGAFINHRQNLKAKKIKHSAKIAHNFTDGADRRARTAMTNDSTSAPARSVLRLSHPSSGSGSVRTSAEPKALANLASAVTNKTTSVDWIKTVLISNGNKSAD